MKNLDKFFEVCYNKGKRMTKLKNEISAILYLSSEWLKKKVSYIFRNTIAWFKLQIMDLQDVGKEIKEDISDLLL